MNISDTLYASSYLGLEWHYLHGSLVPGSGSMPLYPLTSDSTYYAVITNECGSTASSDSIFYSNPFTGVKENKNDINLMVYPNPAHNEVTLQFSELPQCIREFQITNILSEIVETHKITSQTTRFSFHQPAGTYLIIIPSDRGNVTKQLIIRIKA